MQKMGWFELGGTQGHGQCHHSIERVRLFDFNRNYVSILYRFRDIAGYLLKVADFDPPHLHLAPLQGVTRIEFCGDLCRQKTRVPGVVRVIVRLAILVEHRLVTDGHRYGHRPMVSTANA